MAKSVRKKKIKLAPERLSAIHLENFQKQIAELKVQGKEKYTPKVGRLVKQLEKKISRLNL